MRRFFQFKPLLQFKLQLAVGLVFVVHTLFYVWALGGDAVDDAYISFRYAGNAILGHGLVFNPGERVEGFTNFLWTAFMIPLEGIEVDVGRASMLLGVLFALATLWLVIRFAQLAGAPKAVATLAILLLAVDGSFALWAVSGLETCLFAFLVFAGAVLYVREQTASTLPLSGIFFALAAMTRPEGLMVFAITVAHQAAWRVLAERRLFTWGDIGRVFSFGVLFAPYWLGRWQYYHSFLPNSFHAKVSATGPEAQLTRGWNHLSQFVGVHLGWIILLPPLAALANAVRSNESHRVIQIPGFSAPPSEAKKPGISPQAQERVSQLFWTTYFAALIMPYAAYIVYVGGDWSVGRFFVPLLAPFYVLFSTGLVDLWRIVVDNWGRRGQIRMVWGTTASILLAGGLFVFSSWNGEYGIFIRGFDAATATAARETMGKWLRTNTPRGTLIAVDAAGQVPYFSGLPAIDMFGINDLHIGRLAVATLGQGTPGHEKFDLGYVLVREPAYVVIYGTLLDSVKEYERAPVMWTSNPEYMKFLTLYRRKN
jgi:arabinofuranosyltransferase